MNADEYRAQAQSLRAQADDLERRAYQLQRAEQLRQQAKQMYAQADAISAQYAPVEAAAPAPAPAASVVVQEHSDRQSAESSQAPVEGAALDFTNPDHVARYVAAYYPPPATHEAIKNAA